VAKPGAIKVAHPVARKAVVASKKPGADKKRVKELKNKYSKKGAPVWLTLPLELIMIAWFGWLGYQLIWLPMHPAETSSDRPQPDSKVTVVTEKPETAVRRRPEKKHIIPKPVRRPQPHSVDRTTSSSNPAPPPQKETNPIVEDNTPSAVPLAQLKPEILKELLNGSPTKALKLLKDNYPDATSSPEVAELNKILSSGNLNEKAVAAVFERSIGIKKSLFYKGHRRQIVVTGVKGTTISVDVYSQTGSSGKARPAKIKISQLDPIEQSRWLGDPETPNIAITKFILHMSSADYATALKLAEKCGPLAEACTAEVNAKIKMLME
jgi:hypothetical protein